MKGIVDFHAANFDATCAGCVERLLKTQPGVLDTVIDCQSRSFSIEYDSRVISDERIAHVAHRFAPQLLTQSQNCAGRLNQGTCESCVLHVEKSHFLTPGVRRATASFRDRILELNFSGAVMASEAATGFGTLEAVPANFVPDKRLASEREPPAAKMLERDQGILGRAEAIFVGATLLLLIAGLFVERFYGRGILWAVLFAGAYFFGGYFGTLAGIASIKRHKIDVDILMVLAALGAAYVGAPFEGAMLLFLFSFSNLLQVSRLARDSTIAKLIRMVEEAQAEKANTQRFLEKGEQTYATGVVLFTIALVLIPWLVAGQSFHDVFYRAMTVMVVASPCALIISTPASILSAIGCGARRGVLFKGGAYLEELARIDIIAFDKTGTLTLGKPLVTDVISTTERSRIAPGGTGSTVGVEDALLQLAASVEARSEHPLAKAVVEFAKSKDLSLIECNGIAMGAAGTDVAMETADVVLMSDNLKNIPFALQLSRRSQTIIFQNLAFSLAVIVVLVAFALGFHLPLPIGVVGHEGSTVLVCLNGLRLLAFRE